MSGLVRFGISLDEGLLKKFDEHIHNRNYSNRSEAIRDLIREDLVKREWRENKEITGAITVVYDHHTRELVNRVLDLQHDYHDQIISTQHIHLDHDNCLEIIVARGKSKDVEALFGHLRSLKGIKHAGLSMTTVGSDLT